MILRLYVSVGSILRALQKERYRPELSLLLLAAGSDEELLQRAQGRNFLARTIQSFQSVIAEAKEAGRLVRFNGRWICGASIYSPFVMVNEAERLAAMGMFKRFGIELGLAEENQPLPDLLAPFASSIELQLIG